METNDKERLCGTCLFMVKSGLGYYCLAHECYTGQFAMACEDFIPNETALKEYETALKEYRRKLKHDK